MQRAWLESPYKVLSLMSQQLSLNLSSEPVSVETKNDVDDSFSHGLGGTRLYHIWANMHSRCYNPTSASFIHYGGRGIQVCNRWNNVVNFLEDMGHPPQGMSIDRINNDGNYTPENCRWATQEEQNSNTSRNRYVTWRGREQTIKAWAMELDLNPKSISERLNRGWTVERALTTPTPRKYEEGRRLHIESNRLQWVKNGRRYRANSRARRV